MKVFKIIWLENLSLGDLLCIVNDLTGNETELEIVSLAGPFHQVGTRTVIMMVRRMMVIVILIADVTTILPD